MICEGPVHGFAMRQEASWNKFSSCGVMSQFKRRSDALGVSSDYAMRSTITSVWSRRRPRDRRDCNRGPTFGYLSDLGECLGYHALTEIRRFQMADRPPSTDNSTPFTKLESSEARNSATVAISSERPIFPRGIRVSNISFASLVRTSSCIGVAIGPGPSTFTRIFLPFSSLSHVRAKERNAALLAAYTPKPGKPFTEATDPVMMIDPPSLNSGNAF